ncbi:MAG TPA: AfsR/SARP family transcriptional regulator [Gaiellaceae bacterium]|nr:AfsR/SARP family transcriptional regulator [Gaiellaceae bacterium]
MLEFSILGPLDVVADGRTIRLGGPKQRATLAILLLSANRVVPVDRLADDLYAGAPPVTAVTQVQRQVSELRKALGADAIETRAPGYVLHVEPDRLDLDRFERWTSEAAHALARSEHARAAELLARALELWRGAPLADVAYEPFAQTAIGRLEELRLGALELRYEAELALGRHGAVLAGLEALVWDNPLRERLRALLMVALYRAGRQADALEVYRTARQTLVEQLGIEPSPALTALQRAILAHDPSLEAASPTAERQTESARTVLVAAFDVDRFDELLSVASPLVSLPDRALLLARLVSAEDELAAAAASVSARASALAAPARAAAFTSAEPARDVVRLATNYDVELVVLHAPANVDGEQLPPELAAICDRSPADVVALSGPPPHWSRGTGVFVPFGGAEHDWSALALAAWLAGGAAAPLSLVGTRADATRGVRDASRLLADASLAVQRVVGISATPVLADAREDALVAAIAGASVVVAGLPTRWRTEGLGSIRRALVRTNEPVLLVHGGMRPSGLAPRESLTRFSWSLEPSPL